MSFPLSRRTPYLAVAISSVLLAASASVAAETYEIRTKISGLKARPTTNFTSHSFTTCGQAGRTGPSLLQCQSAYSGSEVLSGENGFNVTSGVQSWRVPVDGEYTISAKGAQGGGVPGYGQVGGRGATMQGVFSLKGGETLSIVVGQKGGDEMDTGHGGGGGGGASFVYQGQIGGAGLLIAAAGGSGAKEDNMGSSVNGVKGTVPVYNGGAGVGYGGGSDGGGGGAGWRSPGQDGRYGTEGGDQWIGGASTGGNAGDNWGGFGGGGGGNNNESGGGGGYTGGNGSGDTGSNVSGGGSFNGGTNQSNLTGANQGHGSVTITLVQ